jgi:hypothetical protein
LRNAYIHVVANQFTYMKCEICDKDNAKKNSCKTVIADVEVVRCQICNTRFCNKHGDFERLMCNSCIEFDEALGVDAGDIEDV